MFTDTEITAIHEAGHAVAAMRLGLIFSHVSTIPDGDTDGALHWTELQSAGDVQITPELDAIVLLAGPFAEARLLQSSLDAVLAGEAAADDREALATLGLSADHFLGASRAALALIEKDWTVIERVADELVERETLAFADVERLIASFGR